MSAYDLPDTDELEDDDVSTLDPSKPLPHMRRERAVQLYLSGMTKTDSYEGAGYVRNHQHASRLFACDDMKMRIDYLRAAEADRAAEERAAQRMSSGYTKLLAMTQLELARALAMKNDRPSAAVSAITVMAKLEGLIREMPSMTPSLSGYTVEQLEQLRDDLNAAERTVGDEIEGRAGTAQAPGDSGDTKPRPN